MFSGRSSESTTPLQEPQVGRDQLGAVVGDEDPLHVELHAVLALRLEEVEGRLRRDEQQAAVLDHALGLEVRPQPGLVEGVGDVVVELLVLLVGDLRLGPAPQRRGSIEVLRLAGQADRHRDVVGIGLHDAAQALRLQVLALVRFQLEGDPGAARRRIVALADREVAFPVRLPAPGRGLAGPPGIDRHRVGDHEGRVEADPELADLVDVGALVVEPLQEGGGPGAGDGAQVLDQLVAAHAQAVVLDHQGAGRLVGGQGDREVGVLGGQPGLGQRQVAQPVAGI